MSEPLKASPEPSVEVTFPLRPEHRAILDPGALALLADLHTRFEARRQALLVTRAKRQAAIDGGKLPDFRADTQAIREADWRVAPIPEALLDRRVEITGPTDRKMVINAMNSGANVFMADFEDATTPSFTNLLDGQINLADTVARRIEYYAPDGRSYRLNAKTAVLMVRPRGWHLPERNITVEGEPIAGALFDAALFAYHNGEALAAEGLGPFFYLPKLESMEEAALWDDVFAAIEQALGLTKGTCHVTVLIETLPAAFEMDEILYALRDRITGLNCGRWDYIFSYLKTLRAHPDRVLPDRAEVTMTVPFMRAYSQYLIRVCHRRGAFAMGGMAAQIPIKSDKAANEAALAKVRADKLREATDGYDGTWVAHPGLVALAREVFDAHMPTPNQITVLRDDVEVTAAMLLAPCAGTITEAGFDGNIEVALRYMAAWLDGLGCVPINHQMEDAATAEIARTQLWQWLHHKGAPLSFAGGAPITMARFESVLADRVATLAASEFVGAHKAKASGALLSELTHQDTLADFMTLPAYEQV